MTPAADRTRPRTHAECPPPTEPCPWAGCRHHLVTELYQIGGARRLTVAGVPVPRSRASWAIGEWLEASAEAVIAAPSEQTCSLRVAGAGPQTQEQVAARLEVTKQAIGHIEDRALAVLGDGRLDAVDAGPYAPRVVVPRGPDASPRRVSPAALIAARRAADLGTDGLAERLGVRRNTVTAWERGDQPVGTALVSRLERALSVVPGALYARPEIVGA